MKNSSNRSGILAVAMLFAVVPAHAFTVANSAGPTTATAGAATCATFDAPATAVCSITGGETGPYFDFTAEPQGIRARGANAFVNPPVVENSISLQLGGTATYLGFLTTSNDGLGNVVEFYNGSTFLGSLNGLSWANPPNYPPTFVDITAGAGEAFDRVVFRAFQGATGINGGVTNGCCFEVDNIATNATVVPAPPALGLLGAALGSLVMRRHRRSSSHR